MPSAPALRPGECDGKLLFTRPAGSGQGIVPSAESRPARENIMPNDAKFGLVVGLGLVILVGVVFFGKELVPEAAPATSSLAVAAAGSVGDQPKEERPTAQKTSQTRLAEGGVVLPANEDVVKKD